MFKVCCCVTLAALTLSSQTLNQPFDEVNPPSSVPVAQAAIKVRSILLAMKNPAAPGDSLSQQLADTMLALALPERRPTRSQLNAFTIELANALSGKAFNNEQATTLQQCIVDLLRANNITNYQLAQRLRDTLSPLGISDPGADLIMRRYLAIGEAVRGPDDQGLRSIVQYQKQK